MVCRAPWQGEHLAIPHGGYSLLIVMLMCVGEEYRQDRGRVRRGSRGPGARLLESPARKSRRPAPSAGSFRSIGRAVEVPPSSDIETDTSGILTLETKLRGQDEAQ